MSKFSGIDLTCIRGQKTVFERLSFTIESGQLLALTGPNGAGKTSLLRMMVGLLTISGGQLLWDGAPIIEIEDKIHWIGPQNPLKPELTIAENLQFWTGVLGVPRQKTDINKALHKLEMVHLADIPAQYLSAGQARRASLCRLFLAEKPLWLLDEPATGLDKDIAASLVALVQEHIGNGGMAIVATHRPDFWTPSVTLPIKLMEPEHV